MISKITYAIFIILIIKINICDSKDNDDLFSTSQKLIELARSLDLIMQLKINYLVKENVKYKEVVDNFHYFKNHSVKNPYKFTGNPINCFLLIKSFTKDLEKFNDSKILNELNEYFVPTIKDYPQYHNKLFKF